MIDRRASLSRVLSLLGLGFATLTALDGCGAGGVGAAVRPKEATAAEGIGEGPCHEADNSGEPLVVDWKPEQRGDLELLMKENVAIVSYSCKGFKLLKDCKVDGKYGFLGMSSKEQVVKLNNADEVKANLPLGGIGIAGNISAEMARGSTLDVAMIMIGKVKTTWAKVQADELKGDCDGATHFVKGAMVGAFVMETGTKGEVKSAAQMFGAGASGASTQREERPEQGRRHRRLREGVARRQEGARAVPGVHPARAEGDPAEDARRLQRAPPRRLRLRRRSPPATTSPSSSRRVRRASSWPRASAPSPKSVAGVPLQSERRERVRRSVWQGQRASCGAPARST